MKESLSIFVTMIILVALIVIFPLYNYFERQDDMSYNLVLKATTNFVDDVTNCGYISQDMFSDYVSQIANTGNLYDIELEAHRKVLVPVDEAASAYNEQFAIDYTNDIFDTNVIQTTGIMDKAIKDGVYKFDVGDRVYIKVKNSSTTMAGAMITAIVPTAMEETIHIYYGGIIKNNTWKQANVPLLDGTDVWLNFNRNDEVGGNMDQVDSIRKKLLAGLSKVTIPVREDLPAQKTPSGHTYATFKGWSTNKSGTGTLYRKDSLNNTIEIGENTTLYAIWEYHSTLPLTYYTESGNPIGGYYAYYDPSKKAYVIKSESIASPVGKPGQVFEGWQTKKNPIKIAIGVKIPIDDTNCVPIFSEKSVIADFEYNGATSGYAQALINVKVNSTYGSLPTPGRTGYRFDGWYLESTFENKVDDNTIVTKDEDHTLYAKWTDNTNPTAGTVTMKKWTSSGYSYTEDSWVNTNIYVAIDSHGSDSGSGVKSTVYSVANTTTGATIATNRGDPITLTAEGRYRIEVKTTDNAGNTATRTYYANIDKTPPTIAITKEGDNSIARFKYEFKDNLSGLQANSTYEHRVRGSLTGWQEQPWSSKELGNGAGEKNVIRYINWGIGSGDNYYVYLRATLKDLAGNTATLSTESGPHVRQ